MQRGRLDIQMALEAMGFTVELGEKLMGQGVLSR